MLPVGDVPVAEHDKKMDMVVTPDGSIADNSALGSEVSGILKDGGLPLIFSYLNSRRNAVIDIVLLSIDGHTYLHLNGSQQLCHTDEICMQCSVRAVRGPLT